MHWNQADKNNRHGALVAAMGGSYALGTFADNFFKQCLVLVAAYASAQGAHSLTAEAGGNPGVMATVIQSVATVLYSLPFVVCSAWAGWLADRRIKKNIIIGAKLTEFISLFVGAYALITGWWTGMLLVVFCMGLQSTFFSPALNGTIPELFSVNMVPRVNSYIKLASTVAILLGIGSAGYILELNPDFAKDYSHPFGRVASGVFIICISLVGVLVSFGIKKHPITQKADKEPFPWAGPLRSFKSFWSYRKDPELFLVFWAEAIFYAVSVIIVICIVNLSKDLGYPPRVSSLLTACILIGIAIGAIIAGRFDVYSWRRFAVPSALGMGAMIALASLVPSIQPEPFFLFNDFRLASFYGIVLLAGVCGGIYLIPIASFIQAHPPANEKGKALGVSNFFSYVAMMASAPVFYGLGLVGPSTLVFLVYGLFFMVFALLVLVPGIKRYCGTTLQLRGNSIPGEIIKGLLSLRYTVREKGLNKIVIEQGDKRPFLFLPNHSSMVDPLIVYSRIINLYPKILVVSNHLPKAAILMKRLWGLIEIDDISKNGFHAADSVRRGLDDVVNALRQGESVVLYPSGRMTLDGHEWIGGNSAVEHVIKAVPDVRIIMVRHTGLWGSMFSMASGKVPRFTRTLVKMIPKLFINILFFMPKRKVELEFVEAADFPREGSRVDINTYIEGFYEEKYQEACVVPYYFWQGSTPIWGNRAIKEEKAKQSKVPLCIDAETRAYVISVIAEKSQFRGPIEESTHLGRDLGLDSLDMMELAFRFEIEFGCSINDFDFIGTVEDLLFAITGFSPNDKTRTFVPSRRWFSPFAFAEGERLVAVPRGKNLVEAFIEYVRQRGSLPFVAEKNTMLSRVTVFTKALLLRDEFAKIPHNRVGVLLPSSIGSMVTWLGLQMAGKVPVYINWTFGERNIRECIASLDIPHIVTEQGFYDRLTYRYGDITKLHNKFLNIDEMLNSAGLYSRAKNFVKARLLQYCGYGSDALASRVPDTAVVLFTSGSETSPKGVPLSHGNLVTNIEDIRKLLLFKQRTSILAFLPPYHSFGFLLGIGMPCGLGIPCVYHSNPRETFTIAALCKAYCPNLVGATPGFLEPLLAYGKEYLYSIEQAFVGGEKCKDQLFELFAAACPQGTLCEGYGVTEGSLVISINAPDIYKKGSIGKPLESVITAVTTVEEPLRRVPVGSPGQLLVRGPSIISGYFDVADTEKFFAVFEGERWFKTGDIIIEDEEGYLFYKGRLSRFIKRGGEMISLPLIEEIVTAGLGERFTVEGPAPLVVLPEEHPDGTNVLMAVTTLDVDAATLNDILYRAGFPALYRLERVSKVATIPLLANGKVDFTSLREKLVEPN